MPALGNAVGTFPILAWSPVRAAVNPRFQMHPPTELGLRGERDRESGTTRSDWVSSRFVWCWRAVVCSSSFEDGTDMLNLTRLYGGIAQPADTLRYGHGLGAPKSAAQRKPIVVWNITRRCNLKCLHCYSNSEARFYPGELDWDQMNRVVEDLAAFEVPAVLLSGGEPMMHPRFYDLARVVRSHGLRLTVSTNGTRIDRKAAEQLKAIGVTYVGISLDGIGETHDRFRGVSGTFRKVCDAFAHCKAVEQKVGLRLTLTQHTINDLSEILRFIEDHEIDRVCFYHLVHSGRGGGLEDVSDAAVRQALDEIMDWTRRWVERGRPREVLTVDQPVDGAYMLMRMQREGAEEFARVKKLLEWNGGGRNSSGIGIGNIDSQGNVHPDQFWQALNLGNVKDRPFSEIWTQNEDPTLLGLRDRLPRLNGRCRQCQFLNVCGGGFRVRALQTSGDPWGDDPGCYLTDEEISQGI